MSPVHLYKMTMALSRRTLPTAAVRGEVAPAAEEVAEDALEDAVVHEPGDKPRRLDG